jgi:pSer/pThr/pTyr-binding forkhead associated (FHA) protein
MIVCPSCHHEEYEGALFCSECGTQLTLQNSDPEETLINSQEDISHSFSSLSQTGGVDVADAQETLALKIMDGGHLIPLVESDEFTIGRVSGSQPILPDVDLTPFRAYDKGVSRLHASLKIRDGQATIIDLGSANGTRLNGKKMSPHQSYTLRHGDILAFGKLKAAVLIRQNY